MYPICCGIDVHKSFVVAVIAHTNDEGITEYIRHRFSTFTNSLKELAQWLEYHSCFDVFMESTGKYCIPVYNILDNPDESHDIQTLMGKNMKATVEQLTLATDCDITPEQADKLRVIKAHFDAITFCKNNLDHLITKHSTWVQKSYDRSEDTF